MNILQINAVCGIGSTGRIATEMHAILLSQGHETSVAFGRYKARNCIDNIRIGSRFDTYLHVARTRLFDQHGFGSVSATKAFVSKIKTLNPDLVHLHNLHGYYIHIGLLFEYLKSINKPIVWTLHDCWAFTGHCSHFDFIGCSRWQKECHDCPLKSEYPKSLWLDNSRGNFQQKKALFIGVDNLTIVTPSQWLADLVKKSFLGDYPVKVINNGIDLSVFQSSSSTFRNQYKLEDKFILLGVATDWNERKGYGYFLKLVKRLKFDEILVLVGVSENQIKKLPHNIIGIAKTNNTSELAEIYSMADVFVNPTLEEVLGLVNLEALSCGTPVVTFNSGGSPECLDETCGLVVERGDLPALESAIATIKKNGKSSYSVACRRRVEYLFNKDARCAEYLDLYKGCLNA